MAASGTRSLVFIDSVTANRSSRMNSEVHKAIRCAQIQTNAAKHEDQSSQCNNPKHTTKATQESLKAQKWGTLQRPSQSPELSQRQHAFQLLETKLKANRATYKQQLKAAAVTALQSISREEPQLLVMFIYKIDIKCM